MLEGLDLPEDFDVVSIDPEESDSDAICSMSEGETCTEQHCGAATGILPEALFVLIGEPSGWQVQVDILEEQARCEHNWIINQELGTIYIKCRFCGQQTTQRARAHCSKCRLTTCTICAEHYLAMTVEVAPQPPTPFHGGNLVNELIEYIDFLLAENRRLQAEIERLRKKTNTEEEVLEKELMKEMRELALEDLQKREEHLTFLEENSILKISEGFLLWSEYTLIMMRPICIW